MENKEKPKEIYIGEEYKIIEISKVAKERHYLIIPSGDDLPEGIDSQYSFFKDICSVHLDQIMEKIRDDFEKKFGKTTGFRICVNFGHAGARLTPHIHILPITDNEKIEPRIVHQSISKR